MTPADLADALAMRALTLPMPDWCHDRRLSAWARVALAVMDERAAGGRRALTTATEIASRLRVVVPSEDAALRAGIAEAERVGLCTRVVGGGWLLNRPAFAARHVGFWEQLEADMKEPPSTGIGEGSGNHLERGGVNG